jgi:hypothetical protein
MGWNGSSCDVKGQSPAPGRKTELPVGTKSNLPRTFPKPFLSPLLDSLPPVLPE